MYSESVSELRAERGLFSGRGKMVVKTPPTGERLAIIRRQARLSQRDAAKATGIPKNSISLIEQCIQPVLGERVTDLLNIYNKELIKAGRKPYTTDNVLMDIEFKAH